MHENSSWHFRTCVGLVDADGPVFLFGVGGTVRKICCRSVIVEDRAFVRPTHAEFS